MSGASAVDAKAPRHPVDVAVGVLIDADGRFLLTSRPTGKVYAGYWEFPGGKLEAGESVEAGAAARAARGARHHDRRRRAVERRRCMDYAHARVRLHFCKVLDWRGEFEMTRAPGDGVADAAGRRSRRCCPARCRCCDWFAAEQGFAGATHSSPEAPLH